VLVVDGIRTSRFLCDIAADPPNLYCWEIDLRRGMVTEGALDDHPVEMPRVDERRNGRLYRYAYTVEYREIGPGKVPRSSPLLRYDVETGT
jgi:carotenoid cleavage dioxygenase